MYQRFKKRRFFAKIAKRFSKTNRFLKSKWQFILKMSNVGGQTETFYDGITGNESENEEGDMSVEPANPSSGRIKEIVAPENEHEEGERISGPSKIKIPVKVDVQAEEERNDLSDSLD